MAEIKEQYKNINKNFFRDKKAKEILLLKDESKINGIKEEIESRYLRDEELSEKFSYFLVSLVNLFTDGQGANENNKTCGKALVGSAEQVLRNFHENYFEIYKTLYFLEKILSNRGKSFKEKYYELEPNVSPGIDNLTELLKILLRNSFETEEIILYVLKIVSLPGMDKCSLEKEGLLEDLLFHKNPYIVRGALYYLGTKGGNTEFSLFLLFLVNKKRRIIKREIIVEIFNLFFKKDENFKVILQEKITEDFELRGYLRFMDLTGKNIPKYSIYPSNDYLKQCINKRGYNYDLFIFKVKSLGVKKY